MQRKIFSFVAPSGEQELTYKVRR